MKELELMRYKWRRKQEKEQPAPTAQQLIDSYKAWQKRCRLRELEAKRNNHLSKSQ
jgi:hypothetical protein